MVPRLSQMAMVKRSLIMQSSGVTQCIVYLKDVID